MAIVLNHTIVPARDKKAAGGTKTQRGQKEGEQDLLAQFLLDNLQ